MSTIRSCALCSVSNFTDCASLQCYFKRVSNVLLILILHASEIMIITDLNLIFFICSMLFKQYRSSLKPLNFELHRALTTSILLQCLFLIAEFLLTHQLQFTHKTSLTHHCFLSLTTLLKWRFSSLLKDCLSLIEKVKWWTLCTVVW